MKVDCSHSGIWEKPPRMTNALDESMVTEIDHIGIAVRNLEEAVSSYRGILDLVFEGTEEVTQQQVRVAKFHIGGVMIELLQPTHPDGAIAKFIEKRGEGIHHIAFGVMDIDRCLRELRAKGVALIDQEARAGVGGSRIAFLHPKGMHGVLTELVERKR